MIEKMTVISDCRGLDNDGIITKIAEDRGIDDLYEFLHPTSELLIEYEELHNIDKAYALVEEAIDNGDKIVILADVDCDGISSGAIMHRYLSHFSENIFTEINEGKQHGIEDLETDADLLIVVDSINKAEEYKRFIDQGVKVVVLDHHIPPSPVEDYKDIVLVSSAVDYSNPELSGAGVVWKFCKYLDEMFLSDYADNYADLAACGLVADMVDLSVPENRYIVYTGLKHLNNAGVKALVGGYTFDSQAITYSVASAINACNRMNRNEVALEMFLDDDANECKARAELMKQIKDEQNAMVAELMPSLIDEADRQVNDGYNIIFLELDTEYGVGGLIANKLLEIYKRPIIIVKQCGNEYSGSMRACGVANFSAMVNETGLAHCEGHENAAGFFCDTDKREDFLRYIEDRFANIELEERVFADIQLDVGQVNTALINNIKAINYVSGAGFKPIRVLISGVNNYEVSSMSNGKHLKLITDTCLLIKWNDCPTEKFTGQPVSVIGTLNAGYFGRKLYNQLIIDKYWDGE